MNDKKLLEKFDYALDREKSRLVHNVSVKICAYVHHVKPMTPTAVETLYYYAYSTLGFVNHGGAKELAREESGRVGNDVDYYPMWKNETKEVANLDPENMAIDISISNEVTKEIESYDEPWFANCNQDYTIEAKEAHKHGGDPNGFIYEKTVEIAADLGICEEDMDFNAMQAGFALKYAELYLLGGSNE